MFSWIAKWFRRDDEDDFTVYKPKERLIFRYYDGKKEVRADPMDLYERLMKVWTELAVDLKVSNTPSKDAADARIKASKKICAVFEVEPLDKNPDGGGLTFFELLELLARFWQFSNSLKKKSDPPSTSSEDESNGTSPSPVGGPPTGPITDGGSAAIENTTENPNPLQWGYVSPSD